MAPGSAAPAALLAAALAVGAVLQGVAAESCYWCGPAAEQVNRSRRPPPCAVPFDAGLAGRCDAGLHCASVAASPPYVESRICTKYHQDECSTRFCNRTQTWRVTCTCKGDLCNGEKDRRVLEAFADIPELNVTATTSKALVSTSTQGVVAERTTGPTHEFHNAHEMSSLWTTSSESETAEQMPAAAALQGGEGLEGGGGEDDEDAAEGSGAALRSDGSRAAATEETTRPQTTTEAPVNANGTAATVASLKLALAAGILLSLT